MRRFARITGRTLSLATVVKRLPPGFNAPFNVRRGNSALIIVTGEGDLDAFLTAFNEDTAGVFRAEEMSATAAREIFALYDEVWPYEEV